jgi:hypothetical protein
LIYGLAISIPVFILISLIFFTVAAIDGAMFGTPENELDTIITG